MKKKMSLLTMALCLLILALPITAFASDETPPPPPPTIASTSSHGSGGW